ncbi:GTPase activator [Micromonospora sp. CPCC 206171]|uniref:GTPase activator n=1 Tax=Micromonospora sp. CPCC 206171 TaxID=3122405 RepID=UPI002FF15AFB
MTQEQQPGDGHNSSSAPLGGAPDRMRAVPDDAEARRVREAEEAHGGSMAPGLVDETGRPVAEPPPPPAAEEDGTGS